MSAVGLSGMRRLDEVDVTVLGMLQANPRAPVALLARAVHLTDNAVRYRLRRLERTGVIRGFVTVLDPRFLGMPELHLVLAKLPEPAVLADAVQRIPQVHGAYVTEGPYNALFYVSTRPEEPLAPILERLAQLTKVTDIVTMKVRDAHRGASMPLVPPPLGLDDATRGTGDDASRFAPVMPAPAPPTTQAFRF